MKHCKIILKGVEYTLEEFKDYVLANGMGALLGESPSKLAQDIVAKYDVANADESLDEMWARLNMEKAGKSPQGLLSREEIEKELSPKGQLTDYSTQETIRYNTYAGIDLTGISANFGKTLGYTFEGAPVETVLDTESGNVIHVASEDFKNILENANVYSVEGLLEKSNRYKVQTRNNLLLDAKYSFSIDGRKIDALQRDTIKFDARQSAPNVFETIDTIINLAIDNVKEQKLSVLGITSVNANTYLTMIGMGVPLKIASKIFKTPIMMEANENTRWDSAVLNNYLDPSIEKFIALSDDDLKQTLEAYTGSSFKAKQILRDIRKRQDTESVLEDLDINTSILDDVYTGKADENLRALSDIVVLSTAKKLIPIGQELFDYAQIFSTLRSLPNKKWKVDSVIEKLEDHNSLKSEVNSPAKDKSAIKAALMEAFKEQSDAYKELASTDQEAADSMANEEVYKAMQEESLLGTLSATVRASFVNRMLRGDADKTATPNNTVFKNLAILRIPHVFAAYKTLLQLRSILENSFAVYNPVVQNFIRNLLSETNIYVGNDSLEKVDQVSKELLKFLSSNISFDLEGEEFTTDVDPTVEYYGHNTVLRGKEAWAQIFLKDVEKLDKEPDMETNAFVRSLEISTDVNGFSKLQIVADKANDEEILEEIRSAFKDLTQDHTPLGNTTRAEFAKNLFKYALMSESMYYEKTGFALIFPAHWVVKFGVALDSRLESVIPKGRSITDINLSILKDKFIFQFLKNNPSLVSKQTRYKPVVQSVKKVQNKEQQSFAGHDVSEDSSIYFDLKLPVPFSDKTPKFIRRYDDSVYMLIHTSGKQFSYYMKLTEKVSSRFYDLNITELYDSLDLSPLQSGKYPVINLSSIISGKLTTDFRTHKLEEGQTVAAFAKSSANANSINYYKVTKVSELPDKMVYTLAFLESQKITKGEEGERLKAFAANFFTERLGTTVVVENLKKYRDILFKNAKARLLTNANTEASGAIQLPITELAPNLTTEQQADALKHILEAIEKLDKNLNYYVDQSILSPLDGNSYIRNQVATALNERIGFKEPLRQMDFEDEVAAKAVMKYVKERELMSWVFKDGSKITSVEGQTATHEVPVKGRMKGVESGDFVSAGDNKYFYVLDNDQKTLKLLEFGEQVFLALQTKNMSLDEFLKLYESQVKC